jgi:hypothetical protein
MFTPTTLAALDESIEENKKGLEKLELIADHNVK